MGLEIFLAACHGKLLVFRMVCESTESFCCVKEIISLVLLPMSCSISFLLVVGSKVSAMYKKACAVVALVVVEGGVC